MLEALFVAAANATPATTAAAGGAFDWKWLVPVITLILGFVLKWFQDYVTEKRGRKAEAALRRELRWDELRSRRVDAERANLIALQKIVVNLLQAGRNMRVARTHARPEGEGWYRATVDSYLDVELNRLAAELSPLSVRLHTADVAGQLNMFMGAFWEALSADTATEAWDLWREAEGFHGNLQRLMGETIKQLEDENQQLGAPPAQ
ncbi:hypothetical protein [Stenotrophomonas maltophilia]|uniref:hypothetical protein n=1 Tax=Stenotrophomonas maltophilia TaxID=40324 RepID=UPI00289537DB|nr:hypothetical protein [Stenotrophomonas maltophilia]MDT3487624.1 hypothetical protein [Stenotrophomonas maltophilia]